MESLQSTSFTSGLFHHPIVFTVSVIAFIYQKQCRLPPNANISAFFQVDTCKKMTKTHSCQTYNDRDGHINLKENFQFNSNAAKNPQTGDYKAQTCKVVVLASYEMYGKRGYKPLARTSVSLNLLLPDLLSSRLPLSRTIEFEALAGFTIDTTWSAKVIEGCVTEPSVHSTVCNDVSLTTEDDANVNNTGN